MRIDSIQSGYVIDHIQAGYGMEVYNLLGLDNLDCSVALIKNAKSTKLGRKDIIKIDSLIDLDFDLLGYVDPGITVNIIREGSREEKKQLSLPTKLVDVLKCKNPRCITNAESSLHSEFLLVDPAKHSYCCAYCETEFHRG